MMRSEVLSGLAHSISYSLLRLTEPKAAPTSTNSSVPRPAPNGALPPRPTPKTTADRRAEFAIRPGYSSGASSYDGSVGGEDIDDGEQELRVSRHSDILALSDLRQSMVAEGDLTKTVVRIEVRQPTPIAVANAPLLTGNGKIGYGKSHIIYRLSF